MRRGRMTIYFALLLRRPVLLSCSLAILLLTPRSAPAQTPAPPSPPPPPAHEGSAEFAYVGTSGNASTRTVGLGGELIERPGPWELSSKLAYVRNDSESELKAESLALAAKAARALNPRTSVFSRYTYLHDRFAGIESRNAIEAGLAYVLADVAPHKLVVDGALGYAHESRVTGPDLSTATANLGALYTWKMSDTAEIKEEGRFVFSLSDGDDWRFGNIASLNAKLTTLLSLKLSNTIRFVNAPVAGFKQTDTTTAVALVAKF
jgi:putative salt-induced outer membrane protein YdiY